MGFLDDLKANTIWFLSSFKNSDEIVLSKLNGFKGFHIQPLKLMHPLVTTKIVVMLPSLLFGEPSCVSAFSNEPNKSLKKFSTLKMYF